MIGSRSRRLAHRERPAERPTLGALVFFHGFQGAPEDFLPLMDTLDPERRFHAFLPRGPWRMRRGKRSWFNPDPSKELMADLRPVRQWLDGLPFSRTNCVFAGWSQGARVAYALGLEGRPRPAAIVACGGVLPDTRELDLGQPLPPVLIAHGRNDNAVPVESARRARAVLVAAGAPVSYLETPGGHVIDQDVIPQIRKFLAEIG